MATEIKLPRLGQGMESGTIVKWLKSEGDQVEKGEPLYELDTDKVTQEVEADASGVLLKISVQDGEVEVGRTIAVIGEAGEEVEEPAEAKVAEDEHEEAAKRPVRASGPVEGVRGNREVPPTTDDNALAALQAERDELFDRLQRLAAEFDNFRKRNARENAALTERANERLVKELIPILDDLGRALEAAAEHEEAKLEDGVRLVHRSLSDLLAKEGLAVIEVVQKGYKLGDKVLRPARVVVAAPPIHEA